MANLTEAFIITDRELVAMKHHPELIMKHHLLAALSRGANS